VSNTQRHLTLRSLTAWFAAASAALLIAPSSASACEPLVPLVWLFLAPTAVGGFLFASAVGFILIVVIKCAVFLWKSDFRSWSAVFYVLIANIVSAAVGVVVAVAARGPGLVFLFIGILVLFLAYIPPGRRPNMSEKLSRIRPTGIALLLTLVSGNMEPGLHAASWDGKDELGRDAGTGVYFYKLTTGDRTWTRKMVMMR